MKQSLGHILERIKSIYIYIYIGRLRAQLTSSRRHISSYSYISSHNHTSSYNGLSSHIRFFRNLRILSFLASAALIAIMTLAVFPIIRKASTAEATSLPSTTTLTMTTGSESADLSLLVNNASGTFSSSSSDELAKFSIATNNYTGYTLTISGSDDTGLLTNTDTTITTNNTFSSIDTAISETTFDNSIYNGKWGYLPSKYSSVDNTSFRPAPTTTASTLDVTDVANTKKTEADSSSIDCTTYNCNDYTIGLGIRADYTKPVGTYTNTFILTATANPVGYSITYADNTGDSTVTNIPAIQSGVTSSTLVTLNPDKTPTRTGYTFKSWCFGTVSSNGTVCTGTSTNAGGDLDFVNQTIQASGNAITLYATWTANQYTITLNGNGGTLGSTSTKATYNATTLGSITNPTRANTTATRTISGFTLPSSNNASSATVTYPTSGCTSASNCKSTATVSYTFKGWYQESGATNLIASTATTPALSASTAYTNASKQWTYTSGVTLYAGWNSATGTYSSVKLPTITKTGYTCGWTTTATDATSITYSSGASITPSANTTLYGVCTANKYSLTITFAGTGVSSVQVRTAAGTGGTLMGTVSSSGGTVSNLVYNTAYYLYPTYTSGYELSSWAKTSSTGTLSSTSAANPTFTMGAGNGAVTITGKANCTAISGTMQAFTGTASYCSTSGTLSDSRDNQNYTVAKINNKWWMTRNLAIGCNGSGSTYGSGRTTRSLTSSDSNVSDTWSTSSAEAINSSNTGTGGYTTAAMQCNSTYGAWYNYKAATAGTISGSSNRTNATKNICPSGWRLPTKDEFSGITSSVSAFSPVTGGYYSNGSLNRTGLGYWWSATANDDTGRYNLNYRGSSLNTRGNRRYYGLYVRCIKS